MREYRNLLFTASVLCFIAAYGFFNTNPGFSVFLLILGILLFPHRSRKNYGKEKGILSAVLLSFYFFVYLPFSVPVSGECTVTFLDVGQGDCTILEFMDGKTTVIDGGLSQYGTRIVSFLQSRKIHRIDLLIATHLHSDHIGGLPDILSCFPVERFIEPVYPSELSPDTAAVRYLKQALKKENLSPEAVQGGRVLLEGDGYLLEAVSPVASIDSLDLNDYCLILKLTCGRNVFLFTADAGYLAELEILDQNLSADVLKIGHHGSFGSTSTAFLNAVSPKYGVISVGTDNDYELPNPYVLNRLQDYNVHVFRTDQNGTVTMHSDGISITVQCEKP